MTAITRRCEGCGHMFRAQAGDGQRYCSAYCERPAAMAEIYAAIQRQAQDAATRRPA